MKSPYQQFGPMLTEAIVDTLLDEINSIRLHLGMGPVSKELFTATILSNLGDMTEPEWMKEQNDAIENQFVHS